MFTLEEIDEIHERLGNASTLAAYLEALRGIGVTSSDTYLTDGRTTYFGDGGHQVTSEPTHDVFPIAAVGDKVAMAEGLRRHEEEGTSYVEVSRALADAGVEKWTFDTRALTITYYDRAGSELLSERLG
ncbi:DUF1398 domain-containing protein [Kribbella sp. CA-247076]|uniref:DUF1398 domain-containing protein n=1 Tax=Kribbella sp. CA-247076 TaxID=3239941 RepID=UPI003D8B1D25